MRSLLCGLCFCVLLSACAASQSMAPAPEYYAEEAYAGDDMYDAEAAPEADYGGAMETSAMDKPAPAPMRRRAAPARAHAQQAPAAPAGGAVGRRETPSVQADQAQQQSQQEQQQAQAKLEKPMVVYQGWLRLRVRRLLEAQNEIVAKAEAAGGHVASMTRNVIVVKVPGDDFEQAMDVFAAVGELLDRRVQAHDVTAQFQDVQARLRVLKESRERMLVLLENTLKRDEKLAILREVKRLTEQIESMEAQLRTLQGLVDFFTITIELVPVLQDSAPRQHCSPFDWVRGLQPHQPSLTEGKDDVKMELPRGFVLFEDDDIFRARAADTTVIRAAVLDNEPRGDAPFWDEAVQHEMECRDEETAESGEAGALTYRVYRDKDVRPRAYLVAVGTFDDQLAVVEVFFPDQQTFERHRPAVVEALGTFKVK